MRMVILLFFLYFYIKNNFFARLPTYINNFCAKSILCNISKAAVLQPHITLYTCKVHNTYSYKSFHTSITCAEKWMCVETLFTVSLFSGISTKFSLLINYNPHNILFVASV